MNEMQSWLAYIHKGMSPPWLSQMTHCLVEYFQPEQVILFGSYAWGTPDAESDVDLMVIVSSSPLSDYERAVQGHQCLRAFPIPKDVVVRTQAEFDFFKQARASLEYKVADQGKVLYEKSQGLCRNLGDQLLDRSSESGFDYCRPSTDDARVVGELRSAL